MPDTSNLWYSFKHHSLLPQCWSCLVCSVQHWFYFVWFFWHRKRKAGFYPF